MKKQKQHGKTTPDPAHDTAQRWVPLRLPPDPWRLDELHERVTRGEAMLCSKCRTLEGFRELGGRCPGCGDEEEFLHGMPPTGPADVADSIRTALGLPTATQLPPHHEWRSSDASRWDNRAFRGWQDFHIQIITLSRRHLPWYALPLLWILTPDELPSGVQGTRLPLVAEDDDSELGVVRVLMWRKTGEPGYLRGQWVGQLRGYHWDLCDAEKIASERQAVWWAALREAHERGPKPGRRKCFESAKKFEQECRELVTPDGWAAALPIMPAEEKAKRWAAIVAGKISQDTLIWALGVSQSALTRALKDFEHTDGTTWRKWQRRIADWAKAPDEGHRTTF